MDKPAFSSESVGNRVCGVSGHRLTNFGASGDVNLICMTCGLDLEEINSGKVVTVNTGEKDAIST